MARKAVNTKEAEAFPYVTPYGWERVTNRQDDEVVDRPEYYMCEEQKINSDNSDKAWVFTYPEFLIPKRVGHHAVGFHVKEEVYYNRVWVDPQIIYAGFILYDVPEQIIVWNAFLDQSVEIASMTATGTDGTLLDYTIPQTLQPLGAAIWDLIIEKDGPPTQDAYYYPVIGGVTYTIHIYGVRLLTIYSEPNWEMPPSVTMEFMTIVSQSERFYEQRRPLYPNPARDISATYLVQNVEAQIFFNSMSYGHDKVMAVPVYNEQMQSANLSVGNGSITTIGSHEYLWNLHNHCTYIAVTDHVNGVVEVLEIDSFPDNTTIDLVVNITATFDPNSTVIYPVVVSTLKAIKMDTAVDNMDVINVDFKEYVSG